MAPHRPTVRVIEDEAQMRRSLRATLTANGSQLLAATTAPEGLGQAATRQPASILLDLGLPDQVGFPYASVVVHARANRGPSTPRRAPDHRLPARRRRMA
jgi:DNA-binding response OmpR family regulator